MVLILSTHRVYTYYVFFGTPVRQITVNLYSTYNVLLNVSVNPVALAFILWAATENPNSSISCPRTGDSRTIGLVVSSVFNEETLPMTKNSNLFLKKSFIIHVQHL